MELHKPQTLYPNRRSTQLNKNVSGCVKRTNSKHFARLRTWKKHSRHSLLRKHITLPSLQLVQSQHITALTFISSLSLSPSCLSGIRTASLIPDITASKHVTPIWPPKLNGAITKKKAFTVIRLKTVFYHTIDASESSLALICKYWLSEYCTTSPTGRHPYAFHL